MVKVYHFRVYDATKDDWHVPPAKSPETRIALARGEIIQGTAKEVVVTELDDSGRYWPAGSRG
ncbi:hypothetical protein FE249_19145 (plasmid) [Acidiphilium multivorum]|uniref:hypothetical protein n=1 Tax=Acidiphilium multivorum TaxID=62140 RepID=UPI001F4C31AA|nr:hypothetical protein [Acidiphilium multivorum]UNC16325.1 hypothetical protein FE249_19145 [Acidiphilium multivorum]